MMPRYTQRPTVPNVLHQHIEDAAYLWSHRASNLWSPVFFRQHIRRLDNNLDANLEGLRIAGQHTIKKAFKNLSRWQTPEEAFVCTYVVAHTNDSDSLKVLQEQLIEKPSLSEGAAAALLWSEPSITQTFIDKWWFSEHDTLRQAVIPAAITHPNLDMKKFIKQSAEDSYPSVRLKAYRAIGEWQLSGFRGLLEKGVDETNIFCRAEAAASLALLGDRSSITHLPEVFQYFKNSSLQRYLLIKTW